MIAAIDPAIGAIAVALIAAVGGVASAVAANVARKDVRDRIGTPNGHGNVVEMMERLLAGQTGQDNRIARLEEHDLRRQIELAALSERIRRLDGGSLAD